MSLLADLTWPEAEAAGVRGAVLAVPVGATEQHGPHLPLSTDTDVATALCSAFAEQRDIVIAPAVAYGSSGEHQGFAGTISIGQEATELVLVQLGRSASETFRRIVFVSAHGGNAGPVQRAVDRLCAEGRDVIAFYPQWSGDPHAGGAETSLQLALDPRRVHQDRAVRGDEQPLSDTLPLLMQHGVRAVSPSGVLGDPTHASAEAGVELLARLTDDLLATLDAAWVRT